MKENVSSVEYANNWYGTAWKSEIPANLESLHDYLVLEKNPLLLLENLHEQLQSSTQSLIKMLAYSGETLIDLIQNEIDHLTKEAEEQLASLFLREKFGEPGDPLVSAVFAQLAQREVLARKASKNTAVEITKLSEKFEQSILAHLKILIANQINKIEEENKEYVGAEKDSEEISKQTPEITKQMQGYRSKFAKKFKKLEGQKKSLINLYKKIDNHLSFNNKEVVFELAKQSTNPTTL